MVIDKENRESSSVAHLCGFVLDDSYFSDGEFESAKSSEWGASEVALKLSR